MNVSRRRFIEASLGAGVVAATPLRCESDEIKPVSLDELDRVAALPVLRRELFAEPVVIQSIDLLRNGNEYIVRVESKDGAVGYAVSNSAKIRYFYPILLHLVVPTFVGQDARDLDALVDRVYVERSNYKLQGQAFWVCVASVEFAILDMLGQVSGKALGNLVGEVTRNDIGIYRASGNRDTTAQEEVEILQQLLAETEAKAVKFKVGGRMSNNQDSIPGRSEELVRLARETLGDEMTIFTDSNGSYNVEHSIRLGRIMEENNIAFFEEPCPFDQLEETKQVADALDIPIAGGEQESSHWRFRWMIHHNAVQIVQPDLFYYGGYIRAIRVARMAAAAGMECVPHMSGTTLGYAYVLHFASCVPNAGDFMEYKGADENVYYTCATSDLKSRDGRITAPTGPGIGIEIDPEFISQSTIVTG